MRTRWAIVSLCSGIALVAACGSSSADGGGVDASADATQGQPTDGGVPGDTASGFKPCGSTLAGTPFSPEIATCLYTALMTDTGSFMFQGTNQHTFALARELALAGADPSHCARNIYFAHSVAKMRLLGE